MTNGAAEEVYSSPSYRYDNSTRADADSLVVQLTLEGEAFIEGPEGRHPIPADHAMLFSHREPTVYGYPNDGKAPYRLRFIAFSPAHDISVMFDRIRNDFGRVVRIPRGSAVATQYADLFTRSINGRFTDRIEEAELIYRLLIAIYREQVTSTQTTDPIAWGHHLLRDRFRTPINVNEIACTCGISREHLIRGFRERYGVSPGNELRRLRLAYARSVLQSTEYTVEDVAIASGFTSSNTFCRAYRQFFGHSPGNERAKRHR